MLYSRVVAIVQLLFGSALAANNPFQASFPAEAIETFTFQQSAGAVLFKVDPNIGMIEINGEPDSWDEQGCGIDMGQDGDKAWLKLLTEHASVIRSCKANWDVTIPPGVNLKIEFDNGDATFEGPYNGDMKVVLGAGDLTFERATGALDITMGGGQLTGAYTGTDIAIKGSSGGIHLTEMVTPVAIEIGLGNIELSYAKAPIGELELRTGTGAITVRLPAFTPVQTELRGVGPKKVKVPKGSTAKTRIKATVGVGKILIEPLPEPPPPESDVLDE